MSFGFIDLTNSFGKVAAEKFATFFIDYLRGYATTDNIHSFIKKMRTFDFFMLDNLKACQLN